MSASFKTANDMASSAVVLVLDGVRQHTRMQFRRANLNDRTDLDFIEVIHGMIDEQSGLPKVDRPTLLVEAKFSRAQDPDFVCIGEQEGKRASYILLSKIGLPGAEEGYVRQLGVVPELQRQKIGLTSLAWAEAFFRSLSFPSAHLQSTLINKQSLRFYETTGWTPTGLSFGHGQSFIQWKKDLRL